ncbi:MAG: hypothetical protein HC900_00980 [Methylacidiphilales bacterium]|nr:hypothetical protein [Candidatus Methylacidiphilales bacterium]
MSTATRAFSANDDARQDEADRLLLQRPSRAENLLDIDEHLATSARLSRMLWRYFYQLSTDPEKQGLDQRDYDALMELAAILADHTSAALYLFGKEAQ